MDESTQTMGTQSPTPVPGPTVMTSDSMGGKSNKKIAAIVGIIALVLIAGGVGVWAWFTYGIVKTPEQVFAKMVERSKTINSHAFDATIKAGSTNSTDPSKQDTITITMQGAHEGKALPSAKGLLNIGVSFLGADSTTPIEASFELRLTDNVAYGQITKLPDLGALLFGTTEGSTAETTNQVVNKWAALDFNALQQYLQDTKNQPGLAEEQKASIDAGLAVLTGAQSNNQEMMEQVVELAKKHNLIAVKAVLPSETLDAQAMYHYDLVINKANVFPFWKDVMTLFAPDVYNSMTSEELTQAETELNSALAQVQLGAQVWIGKKDYYLHKFIVTVTPDVGNTSGNPAITMDVHFKDFNTSVDVAKPEGAYPALDLLGSVDAFQQSLMGVSEPTTPDTIITDTEQDNDADDLPDFMEVQFYKTDPNNPDTDGDGFKDGEEVKNGYDPLGPGKLY